MADRAPITPQAVAARLMRTRNWHLIEANRADARRLEEAARWRAEAAAHEASAERIAATLREMGFEPQPPMGPRAA